MGAGRRWQGQLRPAEATADAGHVQPATRGAAPHGRLRPVDGPGLRAHRQEEGPHRVPDNFSPHRSTKNDTRVGDWAAANNVELAYVPFYASWLNRIEAQFTALRYFALDGTDHPTHQAQAQARMIRRYIAWRNRHAADQALRELVNRANVA